MTNIITCYIPNVSNNQSVNKRKRLIREDGFEVLSMRQCLSNPLVFARCKIFHLNWVENIKSRGDYYKTAAFILLLKILNKKIIYTIHNKKPHSSNGSIWPEKMMCFACKKADAIVGLCSETKDIVMELDPESISKLHIIPHENYISEYKNNDQSNLRKKYGIPADDTVFLFLGSIAPYKNLEIIIDVFKSVANKNVWLLIGGKSVSKEYGDLIKKRIGDEKRIISDTRYIPESEIVSFYNTADIIILPYQKRISLNSGVVYLSFSLHKTVISSEIGSIKDLKDKSFIYSYDYDDEHEHASKLKAAIMHAINDRIQDDGIIKAKGDAAYEYVKKYHNDALIAKGYSDLYRSLLG